MTYLWNPEWGRERERLEVQARLLDPGTIRHLEALGVDAGWRCAEIAAGTGSIARWLARKVGEGGRVVASDRDTRFLQGLEGPSIEVRRHDIVEEPLEDGAYDLVHTRLLLMHLPARDVALAHMVAALRPGGWLLVEDYDQITAGAFDPPSELQGRVAESVCRLFARADADPHCGRRLPRALLAAGLRNVAAEGRLQVVQLGTPRAEALAMKLEQFRDQLPEAGLVAAEEIDVAVAHVRAAASGFHYTPLMIAAWGQRPLGERTEGAMPAGSSGPSSRTSGRR